MVALNAALAATLATGLASATVLYAVTDQVITNGKQSSVINDLIVWDNNTAGPCTNGGWQAFGTVEPQYTGADASAVSTPYNGTQPWANVSAIFFNQKGVFVTDGVVGAANKDGSTAFTYNLTSNSHCNSFKCTVKNSNNTFSSTFGGFKCTV